MSRIGKNPITVPGGVDVSLVDRLVTVKGPNGTLARQIPGEITVRQDGDQLLVERPNDERENRSLHGLTRTLVANMVQASPVASPRSSRSSVSAIGPRPRARTSSGSPSASAIR